MLLEGRALRLGTYLEQHCKLVYKGWELTWNITGRSRIKAWNFLGTLLEGRALGLGIYLEQHCEVVHKWWEITRNITGRSCTKAWNFLWTLLDGRASRLGTSLKHYWKGMRWALELPWNITGRQCINPSNQYSENLKWTWKFVRCFVMLFEIINPQMKKNYFLTFIY